MFINGDQLKRLDEITQLSELDSQLFSFCLLVSKECKKQHYDSENLNDILFVDWVVADLQ